MATKCPSCGRQVPINESAIGRDTAFEIARLRIEVKTLKSALWDKQVLCDAKQKIAEENATALVHQQKLYDVEVRELKQKLAQARVTNRRGSPGYSDWLTKFRAARAATA